MKRIGETAARTATFNGPAQALTGTINSGNAISINGFARIANPADAGAPVSTATVNMTLFVQTTLADGGTTTAFQPMGLGVTANTATWVPIGGAAGLGFAAAPSTIYLYIEGPPAGVDVRVDQMDVRVLEAN